jgi:predicted metal-dependent phosphoesterase TrpH
MYRFDLHVHTDFGRKRIEPRALIKQCLRVGLSGLAVTDHDRLDFYKKNRKLFADHGLLLMRASEVTSKRGHILAYGIDEPIPLFLTATETIQRIKDQGGIAVAAHPFHFMNSVGDLIHKLPFDGIELFNAFTQIFPFANQLAKEHADELDCLKIGGSDAHSLYFVGKGQTIFSEISSEDEMLELLRQKRFRIEDKTSLPALCKEAFNAALFDWRKTQEVFSALAHL